VQRVLHALPSPLPATVVEPPHHPPHLSSEAAAGSLPGGEPILSPPGPLTCRCGRYLSEDLNNRLFCRACEGYDPADLTPRLPVVHRCR